MEKGNEQINLRCWLRRLSKGSGIPRQSLPPGLYRCPRLGRWLRQVNARRSAVIHILTFARRLDCDALTESVTYKIDRTAFSWREDIGGWPVYSSVLVCPTCLVTWASLKVDNREDIFQVEGTSCEACNRTNHYLRIPGSLLYNSTCNGTDWGLIDAMPSDLVRREFLLHLRANE